MVTLLYVICEVLAEIVIMFGIQACLLVSIFTFVWYIAYQKLLNYIKNKFSEES